MTCAHRDQTGEIAADNAPQAVAHTRSGLKFDVRGPLPGAKQQGDACVLAFRPEDARLGDESGNHLRATVAKVTYVGNSWTLSCSGPDGAPLTVLLHRGYAIPQVGDGVIIGWDPADCMLLNAS